MRWFAASACFAVPQASAPIAFALIALPLTGDANSGAALILAMTLAQLVCAVPLARWGRSRRPMNYLKLLILIRTCALAAIGLLAALEAPFFTLIIAAAVAGSVSGAAFGFLRAVLNELVKAGRLPRALGMAATLNEVVFVSAPVLAASLGAISPLVAMTVMTIMGAAPMILLPAAPKTSPPAIAKTESTSGVLTPKILLWLLCAVAMSAAVGTLEIGAVAMAINFGFDPEMGFIFPLALCLAAITGGLWVTIGNRRPTQQQVIYYLCLSALGAGLVAWNQSVILTLAASTLVGFFFPVMATYFQLVLDELAPVDRRAEVFALLRNANSVGVITISLTLTLWSLSAALVIGAALVLVATLTVIISQLRGNH